MFKTIIDSPIIHGIISPGFIGVKVAFAENFTKRGEVRAICVVYYRGEKVVDLWGGYRDQKTKSPWEKDTLVLVFSTTKGLAPMTLVLAHSRGLLNYDERVSKYWPEVEFPSGSGIGLVRSIAKAYSILATGNRVLGITRETLYELTRPAVQPSFGSHDEVLHVETAFSLGFLKPCAALRFDSSSQAFGMNGTGGSVGFADPGSQIGFAYAPNKMIFGFFGDARAKNLEKAVYKCVGRITA